MKDKRQIVISLIFLMIFMLGTGIFFLIQFVNYQNKRIFCEVSYKNNIKIMWEFIDQWEKEISDREQKINMLMQPKKIKFK